MTWNCHGIRCQFRWQTVVDLLWEMTSNFHDSPCQIFLMFPVFLCKPCKKCDTSSHGNSIHMSFLVTNGLQFGQNPHQIPWQFHVIYIGSICFPCWNMTWILDKFKSWPFPWHLLRKWWDFHRIWCHSRPNCCQKDMTRHIFYRVVYFFPSNF